MNIKQSILLMDIDIRYHLTRGKGMISIQFDERDWGGVFKDAFGNEDEANAAIGIVHGAPPEIQILVAQLLTQIEKEVA